VSQISPCLEKSVSEDLHKIPCKAVSILYNMLILTGLKRNKNFGWYIETVAVKYNFTYVSAVGQHISSV